MLQRVLLSFDFAFPSQTPLQTLFALVRSPSDSNSFLNQIHLLARLVFASRPLLTDGTLFALNSHSASRRPDFVDRAVTIVPCNYHRIIRFRSKNERRVSPVERSAASGKSRFLETRSQLSTTLTSSNSSTRTLLARGLEKWTQPASTEREHTGRISNEKETEKEKKVGQKERWRDGRKTKKTLNEKHSYGMKTFGKG